MARLANTLPVQFYRYGRHALRFLGLLRNPSARPDFIETLWQTARSRLSKGVGKGFVIA